MQKERLEKREIQRTHAVPRKGLEDKGVHKNISKKIKGEFAQPLVALSRPEESKGKPAGIAIDPKEVDRIAREAWEHTYV